MKKLLLALVISLVANPTIATITTTTPAVAVNDKEYSIENAVEIYPTTIDAKDGTLIMSNSPETVKDIGLLYADEFEGKGRILYHHVNETGSKSRKLIILAENIADQSVSLNIGKKGISDYSYNFLKVGEDVLDGYFRSDNDKTISIAPHEKYIIYESPKTEWPISTVLSGMMDIQSSGRLRISFAMLDVNDDYYNHGNLKKLDRDFAPRGTYKCLTRHQFVILPENDDAYYKIEQKKDEWVKGYDAVRQEDTVNFGNYGIMYKITLVAKSNAHIYICPRGGIFQGKVSWEKGGIETIKRSHSFKTIKEAIKVGEIANGEIKTLYYCLPNGSAAPILIGVDDLP